MLHVLDFCLFEDTGTDIVRGHGSCEGQLYMYPDVFLLLYPKQPPKIYNFAVLQFWLI